MINTLSLVLLALWVVPHLLIVATIKDSRARTPIFITVGVLLLLSYMLKPHTYDLVKYGAYFDTGYLQTQGWHSRDFDFQLAPKDLTGDPFDEGFAVGFRWLGKFSHRVLPMGNLIPRIDTGEGDFVQRGPPRSDATIFLIVLLGLVFSYNAIRRLANASHKVRNFYEVNFILALPLILGSMYFFLGSQNILRQFLALSMTLMGISMITERRYIACVVFLLLSTTFHWWGWVFGLIAVFLGVIASSSIPSIKANRIAPLAITRPEGVSLLIGIVMVVTIKAIAVFGIFNIDSIPLIGDLKSFIIEEVKFLSLERVKSHIKGIAIVVIFLISEFVLGKSPVSGKIDIRLFRRCTLLLILPFVLYSEIFSRMLVFYWMVEMVFVVWALSSTELRKRISGAVVFSFYGIAPNTINVLIGPHWLFAL
jgi:hypothetical protein